MKMKRDFLFSEFVSAEIGKSDAIHTELTHKEVTHAFIEYGQKHHSYDKEGRKIVLRDNFTVKLNTAKFNKENTISLEFIKYNEKSETVYSIALLLVGGYVSFSGLYNLLIPLVLLFFVSYLAYDKIKGSSDKESVNYSEEADRIFLEISNAISEKEAD